MKPQDDRLFLQHFLDAITTIEKYLDGVDEVTFRKTELLQDGVIRQIQIIGEAAKGISPVYEPNIPKFHGVIWLA